MTRATDWDRLAARWQNRSKAEGVRDIWGLLVERERDARAQREEGGSPISRSAALFGPRCCGGEACPRVPLSPRLEVGSDHGLPNQTFDHVEVGVVALLAAEDEAPEVAVLRFAEVTAHELCRGKGITR